MQGNTAKMIALVCLRICRQVSLIWILILAALCFLFLLLKPQVFIFEVVVETSASIEEDEILPLETPFFYDQIDLTFTEDNLTCYEYHLTYLENPEGICQKSSFLTLIIIFSKVRNFDQRHSIRETWGSLANSNSIPRNKQLVFLIGSDDHLNSINSNDLIQSEALIYGDIVYIDFMDNEENQTLKSILMLKWVEEFCPSAKYVVKTSDDVFLNIYRLEMVANQQARKNDFKIIFGSKIGNDAETRTRAAQKWYWTPWEYPHNFHPPHMSGPTYGISGHLVPYLLNVSYLIPLMSPENLFITGYCGFLLNVTLQDIRGFFPVQDKPPFCSLRKAVSTFSGYTSTDLFDIWDMELNKTLKCRN